MDDIKRLMDTVADRNIELKITPIGIFITKEDGDSFGSQRYKAFYEKELINNLALSFDQLVDIFIDCKVFRRTSDD